MSSITKNSLLFLFAVIIGTTYIQIQEPSQSSRLSIFPILPFTSHTPELKTQPNFHFLSKELLLSQNFSTIPAHALSNDNIFLIQKSKKYGSANLTVLALKDDILQSQLIISTPSSSNSKVLVFPEKVIIIEESHEYSLDLNGTRVELKLLPEDRILLEAREITDTSFLLCWFNTGLLRASSFLVDCQTFEISGDSKIESAVLHFNALLKFPFTNALKMLNESHFLFVYNQFKTENANILKITENKLVHECLDISNSWHFDAAIFKNDYWIIPSFEDSNLYLNVVTSNFELISNTSITANIDQDPFIEIVDLNNGTYLVIWTDKLSQLSGTIISPTGEIIKQEFLIDEEVEHVSDQFALVHSNLDSSIIFVTNVRDKFEKISPIYIKRIAEDAGDSSNLVNIAKILSNAGLIVPLPNNNFLAIYYTEDGTVIKKFGSDLSNSSSQEFAPFTHLIYYIINIVAIFIGALLIKLGKIREQPIHEKSEKPEKSEVIIIPNEKFTKGIAKPTLRPKTDALKTTLKPVKLSWNDFWAPVNPESKWKAYTYWFIRYKYDTKIRDDKVHLDLTVTAHLDKKRAWVKPEFMEDLELLSHEEGHYKIGCICGMEFKKRAKMTIFSVENYKTELTDLFNTTLREYLDFEKKYDDETDHYKNKEGQRRWDELIKQKIEDLREFW